jgi:hypothetical protein
MTEDLSFCSADSGGAKRATDDTPQSRQPGVGSRASSAGEPTAVAAGSVGASEAGRRVKTWAPPR